MRVEDVDDLDRRAVLAGAVLHLLRQFEHARDVELYGSLASGRADRYSDLDLVVHLEGISDKAFADIVPDLLHPLGRQLIAGWALDRLPDTYVRTIYLADYPLFWHVDIGCLSTLHESDDDLATTYHWPQVFKMWIGAVQQFARGNGDGEAFLQHISRWADLSTIRGATPAARLGQSLELCADRARRRGAPCEELYRRCVELRATYLRG